MSLLDITGLSHSFGDKVLYRDASLSLQKGDHMGVVGQNGAGKSTLVKIMNGEVIPDAGDVRWAPNTTIGDLGQYAEVDGAHSVSSYLKTAFAPLYLLESEMQACYDAYAKGSDESDLARAADCQSRLESQGFYETDSEIAKIVTGLGLDAFGLDTPLHALSGGQRAKVILAKLLLEKADALLLDEPTNFLDKEHVAWLSGYLKTFPGAFVVVSHDFEFLDAISTTICDVEFESLRKYHGSYSAFRGQKEHLREDYIRQYNAQKKKIEETEAYIQKNKAGVNAKMARGRQKQLDRLERIAPPSFSQKPVIRLSSLALDAAVALSVKDLEVGYYYPLLPKLNFTVASGQKLVITGFNGIGKSTLLKTLVGKLPALGGGFTFARQVQTGYYEQDLLWPNGGATPTQIISESHPELNEKQIRKHLASCGVRADLVRQPIGTLSGGEQSKVKLARLLLSPMNLLVLDEPTNHLDAETKEALVKALHSFSGTVILVSHEEGFYRDWADKVLAIETLL